MQPNLGTPPGTQLKIIRADHVPSGFKKAYIGKIVTLEHMSEETGDAILAVNFNCEINGVSGEIALHTWHAEYFEIVDVKPVEDIDLLELVGKVKVNN